MTGDFRQLTQTQGTCPNCGYCPHCGRGGHNTLPYMPMYPTTPQPQYGTPYWVYTPTVTGIANGNGNLTGGGWQGNQNTQHQ